ncbi:hypothetical protein FIBSPDRAFT_968632 [Athelia psychrophila]|uniref:Uncharacterized protein n=1 Tax=Athelia psychrophila TaxID=1759441 RepID=A0A167UEL1_9AGAM|nr:hypothetical protein FIBSPDRAFT_968632 [Fibularhizoctonia sp. CBS 109695]
MVSQGAILHSTILPLWPSIWTWLQMLHEHKLMYSRGLFSTPNPDHRQARYAALYGPLRILLFSDPQTALSRAVMHTEGALAMAAALWIEEARDPEAFYGFEMAFMLLEPDKGLSPTSDLSTDILDHLVAGCGGSKDEVVQLLYSRVNTNLKRLEPDPNNLQTDLSLILKQIQSSDTTLCDAILSIVPYTIISMVDTLHLLLNLRSKYLKDRKALPKGILYCPMAVIFAALRSPGPHELGYEGLARLLDTSFFTVVARMALIREPSSDTIFAGILETVLQTICIRFAAHRPLLLAMNRAIAAAFPTGIPGGLIGNVFRTFQSDLTEWTQIEERYYEGDGVCNIICGDPQVCFSI